MAEIVIGLVGGLVILLVGTLIFLEGREQGRQDEHRAWRKGRCLHGYTKKTL